MRIKRIITALIGFPIVSGLLIFGNKYVVDVLFAIVSAISIYEYSSFSSSPPVSLEFTFHSKAQASCCRHTKHFNSLIIISGRKY